MHQQIASPAENELSPNNGASLSVWESVMREVARTSRAVPRSVALTIYQQALRIAHQLVGQPPPGRADDCVAAVVVSHLNLAGLQAEWGDLDSAAGHLCDAHETLIQLFLDGRQDTSLQHAALRHSRETHVALLNHIRAHGPHPLVTRALGAGCLALNADHPIPHCSNPQPQRNLRCPTRCPPCPIHSMPSNPTSILARWKFITRNITRPTSTT